MLANYHTHTTRCNHAVGTEREYVEQAIAAGFTTIGFSDHVPQPYPEDFYSHIRMRMDEIPSYTGTLMALREEYKDRINILIGYEVEYSTRFFPKMLEELKKYPLDYLIQGQHFAVNEIDGFYVGAPFFGEEKLKSYVDTAIEGMETGVFSYLAHPDLPRYQGDEESYLRQMRRLVQRAVELDVPLEVNMYGFSDKRNYPSDLFFNMAREYQPKFVLGCDAHQVHLIRQPEDVPGLMDFLARNGIDCGDNFVTLRKP